MRVLFIIEYYEPHVGGVELIFKNIAEELVKKGHNCIILTSRVEGSKKYEIINGVKIHRVNVPKNSDRYWFTINAIPKAIKLGKWADIIHTTTYTASFPAWISSKVNRKKAIITVHEVFDKMWYRFPISSLSAFLNKTAEKFFISLDFSKYVCVSNYTRNTLRLLGKNDHNLLTIYNGLNYSSIRFDSATKLKDDLKLNDHFVYLYYGRPGVTKGPENLILAVKKIKKKIKNSKCVMILSKSPRKRYNELINLIKENKLEKDIIILDSMNREKLFSYVKTADCIVVPSLSEGFGFCIAETCSLGTPLVASNVAAIPEVISGKYQLVNPNSPDDIAKGVININNKKYIQTDIKLFPIKDTTKNYLEVYKNI